MLSTVLALALGGCATPGGEKHAAPESPPPRATADSRPWRQAGHTDNPGTLKGVVATADNDAWAVGDEGTEPVAMRWGGEAWTKVEVPQRLGLEGLSVVTASGPDDVWVFGRAQPTPDGWAQGARAARWNGSEWTRTWHEPSLMVDAATAAGPDDVWVAGRRRDGNGTCRSVLQHYTAAGWSTVALPSTVCVRALHALSPREVWAVGDNRDKPVTLHWNGRSWRTVPLPPALAGTNGRLDALAAQSPTRLWAVGRTEPTQGVTRPVAVRWNGHTWANVTDSALNEAFTHATADGHGGIFTTTPTARVFHYDGRRWTSERIASDHTITGLAVAPSTRQLLAVGVCCDASDEDTTGKIWLHR
ncbi:hypothetical protein [Streptomyces sp. NPDC054842]